ncbi:MAG: hypothetical protein ACYSW7_08530 [Planctomycetota bacterium]|jgi:hypothetical protein
MDVFEKPDVETPKITILLNWTSSILMQPVKCIWTPWMSKNMPDAIEWILFMFNSVLWGLGLSLLWHRIRPSKNKLKHMEKS